MSEVIVYTACNSYWRLIKAGRRTYESVPAKYAPGVKYLAKTDVENEVITKEQYFDYIGEEYVEE
nr:MAG TPA: hypothetical protein [Caudoviricetes sp.]